MSESLVELLERMRASRAALAAQLHEEARNQGAGKSTYRRATAKRLGIVAALGALTAAWRWRRRR